MDAKKRKVLISTYNDLVQFYFKSGRKEPDFEDKPFSNFLDTLYPVLSNHKFFTDDLFVSSVVWHLEHLNEMPNVTAEWIDSLIAYIEKTFDINKGMHFLVFPLQGSGLKQDISFANFSLLKQKDEVAFIDQISQITSIEKHDVRSFLDHTKTSRSKDFLKANLMVIKIEDQTDNVRHSAYRFAQYSVDFFKLIHTAFGMESSFFRIAEIWEEENRHVAILSKDGWRCGHGFNWNAHLQCKIDLDFMAEAKYQAVFENLYNAFALDDSPDELCYRFINAFLLYTRGVAQKTGQDDEALALLLYITALESLITEGQQEKRLRLAAVLPKIIEIDGYTASEIARTIDELYRKRNDFVHAGKKPHFSYEDKRPNLLERVTALMLLKYFEIESLTIRKAGQTRNSAWNTYLDTIFNNIIFG